MKQITAQQFANIFGIYVAKDKNGYISAYEFKPAKLASQWMSYIETYSTEIAPLISDADLLDWNVLIEPQFVQFSLIPFDEKNAPVYIEGEFYMTSTGEIRTPKRIEKETIND